MEEEKSQNQGKEKRRKTVLIVEDEPQMLKVLQKKISSHGYKTVLAENGEVGIKKITNLNPDIILLDIVLPNKSGFDVLEEMKVRGIEIPVIVLSNLGSDEDKETAKRLGANDYFVKSDVTLRDLMIIISNYVKASKEEDWARKKKPRVEVLVSSAPAATAVREKKLNKTKQNLKKDIKPSQLKT